MFPIGALNHNADLSPATPQARYLPTLRYLTLTGAGFYPDLKKSVSKIAIGSFHM